MNQPLAYEFIRKRTEIKKTKKIEYELVQTRKQLDVIAVALGNQRKKTRKVKQEMYKQERIAIETVTAYEEQREAALAHQLNLDGQTAITASIELQLADSQNNIDL